MLRRVTSKRRSLTSESGEVPTVDPAVHAMRRTGGARREVSERVFLHGEGGELLEGWALNVSRGGVRVILEDKIELGKEYDVVVGDPDKGGTSAKGRIVWIQEESDGVIAGIEFKGLSGEHPSASPSKPPPPPDPTGTK
jgi:hypothetical protein